MSTSLSPGRPGRRRGSFRLRLPFAELVRPNRRRRSLFFWVILIPVFILLGYFVETARVISAGGRELPPWEDIGKKSARASSSLWCSSSGACRDPSCPGAVSPTRFALDRTARSRAVGDFRAWGDCIRCSLAS